MPFLTRRVLFHFRQSLLSSSKKTETQSAPDLVHGIPYTKIASVKGPGEVEEAAAGSGGYTTTSRSDFSQSYPGLYEKQEYHLKQLRDGHPVHLSGKSDTAVNATIYAITGIIGAYVLYLFSDVVRKS